MSEESGPPALEVAIEGRANRKRALPAVALATVLVALAGYVIILVVFRAFGAGGYATFAVYWSALYLAAGSIFGLQQEATRAVRVAASRTDVGSNPRAMAPGLLVGVIAAALIGGTAALWAPHIFGDRAVLDTALICGGVLLYAGHSVMAGSLAGLGSWGRYSVLLIAESVVRVVGILIVIAVGLGLDWVAVVAAAAMGSWLIFFLIAPFRDATLRRIDGTLGESLVRNGQTVLAAAASAVLVTGFPVILRATASSEDAETLGVVILIVTLTRAPIMLPLNAFLGMIVAAFVDRRDAAISAVVRPMALVAAAGFVLAVIAGFVGSPIIGWIFGPQANASPLFIAGATFGAAAIGILSISGAAILARGMHLMYAVGWLSAAGVACALLFLPIGIESRVVISLVAGPAVGVVIHLLALVQRSRSEHPLSV